MVSPQYPVGVAEPHAGHDRGTVDEAPRDPDRLHVQASALHQKPAVLRLDAQAGQLYVRCTVSPHQCTILLNSTLLQRP